MQLSQEYVRKLFSYNQITGELAWRPRNSSEFKTERSFRSWSSRHANKRAGGVTCAGCGKYKFRRVRVDGRLYTEHRLAWLWMTGEYDGVEIDHINHDATDNRWSNLRRVDRAQNCRNSSKRCDNSSGVSGVTWNKARGRWQAQVAMTDSGSRKTFYLGLYDDKEIAKFAAREFMEANGFHQKHGT